MFEASASEDWNAPDPRVGTSFDPADRRGAGFRRALKQRLPLGGRAETRFWLTRARASGLTLPPNVVATRFGADFELLVARLGADAVQGGRVLLQGTGSGAETRFWEPYEPRLLVGVDLFLEPGAPCPLVTSDLRALPFADAAFDGAGSINVLEHVVDVDAAMAESVRVLTPGAWFLASFGPLYYALGGDHLSFLRGGLRNGFNHVLLEADRYRTFVDAMTVPGVDVVDGEPRAGLAYIRSGLFSRLCFDDYRRIFDRWLEVQHLRGLVDLRALRFRAEHPELWRRMLDAGIVEHDLLISTVQVIGRVRR